MGLLDKVKRQQDKPKTTTKIEPTFTPYEIELLLTMVKQTQFKGSDLEKLYNLVLKLQNMYLEIQNKK